MNFSAVIVAAGTGQRAGAGPAKQWRDLGGKPVLRWSAEALTKAGAHQIVVVIRPKDRALAEAALAGLEGCHFANGGVTRARSVASGLAALSPCDAVLIHDAARPFIPEGLIGRLLDALEGAHGAIPALPVSDTLKRQTPAGIQTTAREGLWLAQTPQAFRYQAITSAYADTSRASEVTTDDAAVVEALGGKVVIVQGDPVLMKLTYAEDFTIARALARP